MVASTSKRKAAAEPRATTKPARKKAKTRHISDSDDEYVDQAVEEADINVGSTPVSFQHSEQVHVLSASKQEVIRTALLEWFNTVRDTRGMPWRKPWTSGLSPAARSQRAYEVSPRSISARTPLQHVICRSGCQRLCFNKHRWLL